MLDKIRDIVNKKFKFQERIESGRIKYFNGKMYEEFSLNLEDTAIAILKIRELLGENK